MQRDETFGIMSHFVKKCGVVRKVSFFFAFFKEFALEFITIVGISLSLAMDAFSVCVAAGSKIKQPTLRHYFRLAFHFGFFQFLMPVIGFYGGVLIEGIISSYDHWIAMVILSVIGAKMVWESFKNDKEDVDAKGNDPSRGMTLVLLSILPVSMRQQSGFSFAALKISIDNRQLLSVLFVQQFPLLESPLEKRSVPKPVLG